MTPEQIKRLLLLKQEQVKLKTQPAPESPAQPKQSVDRVIATTPEGGRVIERADGTRAFTSPAYSTINPEQIARILEGAKPSEESRKSFYEGAISEHPVAAGGKTTGGGTTGGLSPSIMENIWGRGAADTPGEKIGVAINEMGRSFFPGVARGAAELAGLPGTLQDVYGAGAEALGGYLGMSPELARALAMGVTAIPMTSGEEARAVLSDFTGGASEYRSETPAGKIAGTVGEFIPGALAFGATSPKALLKYAVAPGVASETAGMATEGTPMEPYARAAAGIAAPFTLGAIEKAALRAVTPNPITDPEKLNAIAKLKSEGVSLTAGQQTGNEALKYQEAATKMGREAFGKQLDEFTAAALKRIKSPFKRATPSAMREAYNRIGGMFDDFASNNTVLADKTLADDVAAVLDDYVQDVSKAAEVPRLRNIGVEVAKLNATGGAIKGADYTKWASALGKLTKSADAATRTAAIGLREALDDALERALTAVGKTDDIARLKEARQMYRDFLIIEGAIVRAGEKAADGIITPQNLRTTATSVDGKRAYSTGKSDLGELSRAGVSMIVPLPQSGTQPRLAAAGAAMGGRATAAGGGAALWTGGDPILSSAAALAAAGYPVARNALKSTNALQAYLANQKLPMTPRIVDERLLSTLATTAAQAGR